MDSRQHSPPVCFTSTRTDTRIDGRRRHAAGNSSSAAILPWLTFQMPALQDQLTTSRLIRLLDLNTPTSLQLLECADSYWILPIRGFLLTKAHCQNATCNRRIVRSVHPVKFPGNTATSTILFERLLSQSQSRNPTEDWVFWLREQLVNHNLPAWRPPSRSQFLPHPSQLRPNLTQSITSPSASLCVAIRYRSDTQISSPSTSP